MAHIDAHLNSFATRCFRDTADADYIAARLCYRSALISQFHWLALQAMEKYLKAILLINRIPARNVRHDLSKAIALCQKLPFDLELFPDTRKFIAHIDEFGSDRYLTQSYCIYGLKLLELDKAVWDLRRYCRVVNFDQELPDGSSKNMLEPYLAMIKAAETNPLNAGLVGGHLESILERKDHPSRGALIWQNAFFYSRPRKTVKVPRWSSGVNSPLSMYPEILKEVEKYVFVPPGIFGSLRDAT